MKKNKFFDEADFGWAHRQVTQAIWAAKLSTEFIREHFPVHEDTDQEGQLRRFYMIDKIGQDAITPFI